MAYAWLDAIRNDPDPNQQKQGNAWLLQQIDRAQDPEGMGSAVFLPENIDKLAMMYLGRPIQNGADFEQIMSGVNRALAGQPKGAKDPSGLFAVPDPGRGEKWAGPLIKAGALAVFGGGLAGLGGAAAEGGVAGAEAGAAGAFDAGGVGAIGSADAAAAGLGGSGLGAGLGGGTVADTFFPDILDTGGYIDPSLGPSVMDTQYSNLPPLDTPTGYVTPGVTDAGLNSGIPGFMNEGFSGLGGAGTGDYLSQLTKLLGQGNSSASSIFGSRGALGTGLAVAPALAAIAYARNQGPFDTSRLTSAYNQIDPNALALPFDLQTARGRENLSSSLTSRGVMGSSFGNQDLASYDFLRQAGRQNILTSGAQAQAGIGGQLLDAQVKERLLKNDLYGRALLALSTGLNPPQTNINVGMPGQSGGSGTDISKLLGLGSSLYSNFFA